MLARSESRRGYDVRVLAVHTSEGNDRPNIDDAAALRDASWWTGSSHAIADDDPGSLLTPAEGCVPYERASWTLRSGNPWSENIELIGWARWTRAEWLDRPRLLDRCAHWLAVRSQARGIPLVKLTPAQYRAGGWGVIGHHDHTVGYSDGTHWDPGPQFPWDVVLSTANAYRNGTLEDDMPYSDWPQKQREHLLTDIETYVVRKLLPEMVRAVWEHRTSGQDVQAQDRLTGIDMVVGATRSDVVNLLGGDDVDEEKVAAALVPQLLAALPSGAVQIGAEQIKAAMREVLRTGTDVA